MMRWSTASISKSTSSALTQKPSSGGGSSLKGSPCLRDSSGSLHFQDLELSHVGEQFLQACFCPFVASASFACWCFLWKNAPDSRDEEPYWFTFSEDFWNSWAWDVAGPLVLCADGKTSVELYELMVAFLQGQELSPEVWNFLFDVSSELFTWRVLCMHERREASLDPQGPKCILCTTSASGGPPLTGLLLYDCRVLRRLAVPVLLCPLAPQHSVLCVGALVTLDVVSDMRVTSCFCDTWSVSLGTRDTERRAIFELGADSTAL